MNGQGRARRGVSAAGIALLTIAASACRHTPDFMWIDDVPAQRSASDGAYVIKPGDVIGVRVFNQDANSVERTRVREDGKISLPFLNDVEVAGLEPGELAHRIQAKLKTFIVNPIVTVVVHERPPLKISVLGEVVRPGMYDLETGSGVLHALAAAGGLTPFAASDRVYVLRRGSPMDANSGPSRIRFRYDDLRRGKARSSDFRLRAGDVVLVE
jgi:polysaccharide export outer membrane protein